MCILNSVSCTPGSMMSYGARSSSGKLLGSADVVSEIPFLIWDLFWKVLRAAFSMVCLVIWAIVFRSYSQS